jgi:hypothetical protein
VRIFRELVSVGCFSARRFLERATVLLSETRQDASASSGKPSLSAAGKHRYCPLKNESFFLNIFKNYDCDCLGGLRRVLQRACRHCDDKNKDFVRVFRALAFFNRWNSNKRSTLRKNLELRNHGIFLKSRGFAFALFGRWKLGHD